MGMILKTNSPILCLERRRQSYVVMDSERIYQEGGPVECHRFIIDSRHISAYGDGEIEMSAEFLNALLEYFENNPKERREVRKRMEKTG